MKRIILIAVIINLTGCAINTRISDTKTRQELTESYLRSHVGGDLKNSINVYQAIQNVFLKISDGVFNKLTDHKRPVIFLDSYTTTIARFARGHQFLVTPDDPKDTLSDGIYIIVLGDELNNAPVGAIEGIVAHELAHRYLEHLLKPTDNCEMEREANKLIKSWGFEEEYLQASKAFGAKHKDDSPCFEEKHRN